MGDRTADGAIGILGAGPTATLVRDTLESLEWPVVPEPGQALEAQDVTLVVTTDAEGLRTVLQRADTPPVYPLGVEAPFTHPDVEPDAAVTDLVADGWHVEAYPTIAVSSESTTVSAVFDATLMTDEPARISEFHITDTPPNTPDTVRADGVVVATPAGSTGYGHAAGGPPLDTDTRSVAVVPVAPFAVDRRAWVDTPPITVTVRRDEGTVSLYSDGGPVTPVDPGERITIDWGPDARVAVPSSSDEKT